MLIKGDRVCDYCYIDKDVKRVYVNKFKVNLDTCKECFKMYPCGILGKKVSEKTHPNSV